MPLTWFNWNDPPPDDCRGGAVAVGNFDGAHLGHARLIRHLREQGRPAVVLSFDPHPLQLLAPDRFQPLLTSPEDRAADLRVCGADRVLFLRTTPELLRLTPHEFFAQVLRDGLRPKALVEGFNFRFGHDRAGDNELLGELCRESGIAMALVPPFQLDAVPVSSSRVRKALLDGDVGEAMRLMGRHYRLHGIVGEGARRGRTLGFPTANLTDVQTLVPGDGVYAVRARFDGETWAGAANVGGNPTFGEQSRKIEIHLIDFVGDIYGRSMTVTFLHRLRETRPFSGADDLVTQLQRDVEQARHIGAEVPT